MSPSAPRVARARWLALGAPAYAYDPRLQSRDMPRGRLVAPGLFAGLFVVNGALRAPASQRARSKRCPTATAPAVPVRVSGRASTWWANVPGRMLLLPPRRNPLAGPTPRPRQHARRQSHHRSARSRTSIGRRPLGGDVQKIGWRTHARIGVPLTVATLLKQLGVLMVSAELVPSPLPGRGSPSAHACATNCEPQRASPKQRHVRVHAQRRRLTLSRRPRTGCERVNRRSRVDHATFAASLPLAQPPICGALTTRQPSASPTEAARASHSLTLSSTTGA